MTRMGRSVVRVDLEALQRRLVIDAQAGDDGQEVKRPVGRFVEGHCAPALGGIAGANHHPDPPASDVCRQVAGVVRTQRTKHLKPTLHEVSGGHQPVNFCNGLTGLAKARCLSFSPESQAAFVRTKPGLFLLPSGAWDGLGALSTPQIHSISLERGSLAL